MKRLLYVLVCAALLLSLAIPVLADPPELPLMSCTKTVYSDSVEYVYDVDYRHDYGYTGPIFDFHVTLGEWTQGQITITPPANWAGSWQGGTYGAETNSNYWSYGNQYIGAWKIFVKAGYGDGNYSFDYSDNLGGTIGQQHGLMAPLVPEPSSLLALGSGLTALLGTALRKRR